MSLQAETAEYEPASKHVTVVKVELPNRDVSLIPVARTTTVLTICMAVFPQGLAIADRNIARPGSGCLVYVPRGFNSLLQSQRSSVTVSKPMRPDSMQRMIDRLTTEFCGKAHMNYMGMSVGTSESVPVFTAPDGQVLPGEREVHAQMMLLLNRVAIKFPVEDIITSLLMRRS